jgi:hypothetical protein
MQLITIVMTMRSISMIAMALAFEMILRSCDALRKFAKGGERCCAICGIVVRGRDLMLVAAGKRSHPFIMQLEEDINQWSRS